jgi:GMP synthase (glutamine-hydrolysing)
MVQWTIFSYMSFEKLKILLIQIRPDQMKDHEFDLVKKFTGLKDEQIKRLDIFADDAEHHILDGVDAIIIGGSGDYLISRGDIKKEVEDICSLAHAARERGIPILGICFGAQILSIAFGGSVHLDEEKAETGTFTISKTNHAEACPIFGDLPSEFAAQLGHKDHIGDIPKGAVHLASSERSHHQAYTFPGEPIFAVTFHPELDEAAMVDRMNYYATEYIGDQASFDAIQKTLKPSHEATSILHKFLEKIVLGGHRYPTDTKNELK